MNEEKAASENPDESSIPLAGDEFDDSKSSFDFGERVDSLVVYDEEEECPYLPDQIARMPLRFPMTNITNSEAEGLLETGFRRSGKFLYRAECANCQACEAIRLDVSRFQPNRSQRRALKKGNSVFDMELSFPIADHERVALFNKHRNVRGLNRHGTDVDINEYKMFLVESCLESFELTYLFKGKIVGAAICDNAENSISAVYTYFDPDLSSFSPGTYSIMKQIEYCQKNKIQYLYLGYFVAGSPHMNYKQKFRPHQRFQKGIWKEYE